MRYYFPGILESGRATEIDSILKQTRSGSDGRRSRVNEWVESVKALGGGNGFPNGINMLAAAFGLMPPPGPDEFDLDDPVSLLLDDDGGGPNKKSGLEDLREEWRPPLKAQFEGWTRTAGYLKAQTVQALLIRVYKVTIRKMPFFRSPDIIEEMIQVEAQSRLYVCEYLETLDAFCKQQRKKINSINKAKKAHTPSSSKQPRSTPRLHRKDSNSSLPPLEPIPSSSSSPPAQDPINAPPPQSSSLFSTLFGFPSPVQGGLDDVD
ncbi:hypothetical protein DL96DRAFT_1049632 [Flagelloscypha sp. PMI_526]|nr:hypothetical protein DL96DRAFT_1049632 [Flagelloscypha sp. PMI_526]